MFVQETEQNLICLYKLSRRIKSIKKSSAHKFHREKELGEMSFKEDLILIALRTFASKTFNKRTENCSRNLIIFKLDHILIV